MPESDPICLIPSGDSPLLAESASGNWSGPPPNWWKNVRPARDEGTPDWICEIVDESLYLDAYTEESLVPV